MNKTMKQMVDRSDWQYVRESLLGQWTERPEWCCSQLRKFLGNVTSASEEKLRIVMNYLVGSGFRTGRIKHKCISNLRARISMELRKRKFQ